MDTRNKNAKNPDYCVPMKLRGARPEDYDHRIDSANGSAKSKPENAQ